MTNLNIIVCLAFAHLNPQNSAILSDPSGFEISPYLLELIMIFYKRKAIRVFAL